MDLPADLLALLRGASTCYLTTPMPDGSPQMTQTRVDTDGEHVLMNTVVGHQRVRNVERDPRVALSVAAPAPAHPLGCVAVRGRVTATTTADKIHAMG